MLLPFFMSISTGTRQPYKLSFIADWHVKVLSRHFDRGFLER
ncbi:MAG: hypothetical protein H6Q41_1569 [Deltaproteobacteria bacterium]|nr:hypothetical protein [Deltaproteobacteria bacterium]